MKFILCLILLVAGCTTTPVTQPQVPLLPKVSPFKSLVVPQAMVTPPARREFIIPIEYPTNKVRWWYLQESSDNKSWTNMWVKGVPVFFSSGKPTTNNDITVIMPTNTTIHFWRLLGTQ